MSRWLLLSELEARLVARGLLSPGSTFTYLTADEHRARGVRLVCPPDMRGAA